MYSGEVQPNIVFMDRLLSWFPPTWPIYIQEECSSSFHFFLNRILHNGFHIHADTIYASILPLSAQLIGWCQEDLTSQCVSYSYTFQVQTKMLKWIDFHGNFNNSFFPKALFIIRIINKIWIKHFLTYISIND